jgi:hypothetical protein
MISGAHAIIYSTNAEADRAFLRVYVTYVDADLQVRSRESHSAREMP